MGRQPITHGLDKDAQQPVPPRSGVAGFLRQRKDAILRSWETRVTSEHHEIKLTGLVLRDDLPDLLDELAAWLATDAAPETSSVATRALAHVMQRLDAELSLAQVFREYRLLREVLIEEMLGAEAAEQERAGGPGEAGREARIEELARLNAGLDVVLSQSIEQFVEERDRRAATERASAAQAAAESETRYRSLFESIDEGFCIVEMIFEGERPTDYRFIRVNPAFERHTGLENVTGKRIREMVPDHDQHWFETYGRVALTGESARFENAARALGRFYDVYAFRVGEPEQRQVAVLFNDITQRRRTEQELSQSEERLRVLVSASSDVVYLMTPDWREMRHLRGREFIADPETRTASWLATYIPEDERSRVMPAIQAAIYHQRTFELEHRVVRVDGSIGWTLSRAVPLLDSHGEIIEWLGMATDITARKRAEEEKSRILREIDEQRDRLQAIVDSLPVGLWLTDASGKMLVINDRARAIWGGQAPAASSVEEYGTYRAWEEESGKLVGPQDMPLARALRGEVCREIGIDFERFDGTRGTQLVSSSPIKAPDGSVQGAVAVVQDITERRQLETALVEADRRKNEFLAVLSHELRNPLAPIANSLYILEHAAAGGEQANRARLVIGRQVAHLSDLVNDLLDVTRITRNKIQLQKERFELNEVVRRTVEDNRSLFDRADVRLLLTPAPRPLAVIADRTRIVQVVGNLMQNAAKFTLKGGCTRVSVAIEANAAVVRVADDGVGVAPETLAGLFQPFMQADETLDRSKGGLGLGLALVKGLVELHGGSVSAHSEGLGKGTEFVVRLPLDTGVALECETTRLQVPKARRRILIIEDNFDAADSLREALELSEHEVVTANNGPEGLAKARLFQPEVVLCDIGLPGMDGFEVARAFRADERFKGAFLVALSGYALPEDLQRAADAGFERHLAKPPRLEKLEQLLAELGPVLRNGGLNRSA